MDLSPEDTSNGGGTSKGGGTPIGSVMSFSGTLEKKVYALGGCCSSWQSFYYHMPAGQSKLLEYKEKPHVDTMKDPNIIHGFYELPSNGKDKAVVEWKHETGTLILQVQ